MTIPYKLWSQDQAIAAAEIWQSDFVDHFGDDDASAPRGTRERVIQKIAASIDRAAYSVDSRLRSHGPSFGSNKKSIHQATAREMADRDARKEAENRQNLTGQFFRDPPPGYSALDRKQSLNHRTTAVSSTAERSS